MLKGLFVFCLILFCFCLNVFAQTVSETFLSDLGISGLEIQGQNMEECKEIEFLPMHKNIDSGDFEVKNGLFFVFSFHARFLPFASKDSFVKIFLNNEEIATIKSTDFVNGFARIEIANEKLLEKNSMKACFKTSFSTTKIVFLNDSFFGYYFQPDFSKKDSFVLEVIPNKTRLFEEVKVKAVLKNHGSKSAIVTIKYRKEALENETPETELVKGKTVFETIIPECLERNNENECIVPSESGMEFFLRPKLVGTLTLLPAIAEYQNQFGEKIIIESNRPQLQVLEPDIRLKAFLKTDQKEFFTATPAIITLLLINDSPTPLYNIIAKIDSGELSVPEEQKTHLIEFIGEKQAIEKQIQASSLNRDGVFEIGCTVTYLDADFQKSYCEKTTIEFKQPQLSQQTIAGMALFLISIGLFAYIFYIKK